MIAELTRWEELVQEASFEELGPGRAEHCRMPDLRGFLRKYGVALMLVLAFLAEGLTVGLIVAKVTEERVTAQMRGDFQAHLDREQELAAAAREKERAAAFLSGEASLQAAMDAEADAIARAIGPMATKRMKLTMLWNILMRVDSAAYPGTVKAVVEQPQQWMFYSEKNPIREDDRELALEQLKAWHDGRYPAGISSAYVYGEWSENDYVLRDRWEKDSRTGYWRMPE